MYSNYLCINFSNEVLKKNVTDFLEFVAAKFEICTTLLSGLYRLKTKIYTVYLGFEIKHSHGI